MGSREIKSPEVVLEAAAETPTTMSASLDGTTTESFRRKKLGMYFLESDDRRTAFAGGYTASGPTPVNIHGKPILDLSKTGGWLAAFFIFGTYITNLHFGLPCSSTLSDKLNLWVHLQVMKWQKEWLTLDYPSTWWHSCSMLCIDPSLVPLMQLTISWEFHRHPLFLVAFLLMHISVVIGPSQFSPQSILQ